MKKLLRSIVMALMLLCTLTLVACKEDTPKLTDQDVVNAAKEAFTINYTEVTTDFTLPTTAAGGVTVSWASSDAAIAISGQNATVTRPAFEDGNKSVVLTATLTKNEASATKEFTVVVVCQEDANTIDALTVAEAIAADQGDTVTVRGVVSGFHWGTYNDANSVQGCYITDATGTIYVYGYLVAQEVEKGDDVVLSATVGAYKENVQLTSPTLVQTVSKGNAISSAAAVTDKTVADLAADLTTDYDTKTYIFEGVQVVKIVTSSYTNYTIEDKSGSAINLYSAADSSEFAWLDEYIGKELNVLFFVNSQNSKGTKWRGHLLDVIEVVGDWSGSTGGGGNDTPVTGTTETIANILAAASSLEHEAKLEGNYETTGTVKSISEAYNSQFGNVTFILTDGTNDIECYRAKGSEAANIAVGDTVTVVGEVQKFYEKIEFAYPTITARTAGQGGGNTGGNEGGNEGGNTGETANTISGALSANASLAEGDTSTNSYTVTGVVAGITEAYNSQYGNVTFNITDGTLQVLVYRATGAEAANLAKNDTVTITGQIKNYYGTLQFVNATITSRVAGEPDDLEGAVVVTISDYAAANSWANGTQYSTLNFDEFTTITATGSSNTGKYYTSGQNWRIYQNESPSVTVTSTKTIASIMIEYASQNTGALTLNGTVVISGAVVEVNGTTVTFSVGNTGSATNGQARITSITIVYAE